MKTEQSLRLSAKGRLTQATEHAKVAHRLLDAMSVPEGTGTLRHMAELRYRTESLVQCVREMDDYINTLTTE